VDIKRTCARIAPSDSTVLLTGETGTGKEVFARLVHAQSSRVGRPFVPVNCGAIPEALLESELFGYVRGAFTGAVNNRRGRIALAEGGTLFLDEVGELPLSLQVKLLRLLQERTYEPVGSSESVQASFRLIAATNRNLEDEVKAGRFRRDLYYRLHVCPVHLPPLRDRREDIAPLFQYFWRARGEQRAVTPEVLRYLEVYSWPGNVRELENVVERLSLCSESALIHAADLPPVIREESGLQSGLVELDRTDAELRLGVTLPGFAPPQLVPPLPTPPALEPLTGGQPVAFAPPEESTDVSLVIPIPAAPPIVDPGLSLPVDLPHLLRDLETAYINKALLATGGNKKEAAKLLGMGRTTLVEKLRRRNADASDL
jgi:sigma-54 dependent transcriptional regulator, flagellar regulatory protein